MDLIEEGLRDWTEIMEGRNVLRRRIKESGLQPEEYFRRRAAKRIAARIGLAYWPALAYGPRIDPAAYAIAERVLAGDGPRWGETDATSAISHGGWDAMDHWGLSAHTVAAMWRAAGCRDCAKFRAQVSSGIVARKGDSTPFFRNFMRGQRWLEQARRGPNLSRQAVAALGRLSPELRRAAISGLQGGPGTLYRTRDLNWEHVLQTQGMIRLGGVRVRAAMAGDRRAAALLGVIPGELAGALAPAFPNLPVALARRVALGESPVALSDGLLTRAEAHSWALDGAPAIPGWLARHYGVPVHRSLRVIRWLVQVQASGRWAALMAERRTRIPGDGMRTWRAIDVLDEVQGEDIVTGSDSVSAVLERAARRLGDAWLTEAMRDHRSLAPGPSWANRLPRWARLLNTPAALAAEGREMSHCVGGYVRAVECGECHILAISSRSGRSTVELTPQLEVAQHRGPRNEAPPSRHEKWLAAWLAAMKGRR